jgi:6,7-dimethyl-8-ribityllumazine synthase
MQNSIISSFEKFDASKIKIGIVVTKFNYDITSKMLESAIKMCQEYLIPEQNIVIKQVAGSVEIPYLLQSLAKKKDLHCLVAIGAVIRGETTHYDYVCKMVCEGIMQVMLGYDIPIGFAVTTTENHQQAVDRISYGGGSVEAALQALKESGFSI